MLSAETYYRSTNDSDTLDHVVELISAVNPNQGTYRPALAVIVTWDHQAEGASPRFFSNGGGGGGHTMMSIIREALLPISDNFVIQQPILRINFSVLKGAFLKQRSCPHPGWKNIDGAIIITFCIGSYWEANPSMLLILTLIHILCLSVYCSSCVNIWWRKLICNLPISQSCHHSAEGQHTSICKRRVAGEADCCLGFSGNCEYISN